ncbi:acetyl-CoA carboxylase biotin carboxyl carrier protein subunit [Variovorax sp. WS11]|uniref:acetyl-CoA carboxylase biotin carboxyl carrier protein n=1 Tax=Variovorax sp. WS11 TaxID=1105204 RepID=UPI000D0CD664|nr:biotin/lipoyl-containing protein [Variovorax sp. WS11]NDZ11665.1 acetyl-CoA carboxylase biotin carboxyl carrier protein subunit [Variovorax sp. WS11]PSL86500.1 acetyl-CoA carboxylase biotin carboxyl carrier protein subunit [Variovorax sp. WS11]
MKSPAQVQELAAWLAATDIGLLELRTPDGVLRLGRGPAGEIEKLDAQDEEAPQAPAALVAVAPSVGVFLHAHPLHAAPLARPGEHVVAGQPVGVIRIGPLLLPVHAPQAGVLIAFLVPDRQAVGWGTPLVELQADE